jgi:hypothetical protein
MRTWLVIATVLVAATLSSHRAHAQVLLGSDDPLRHGHALLIGNSHYRDWPQLNDVPLQLDELSKGLRRHFDTIEVVKNLETEQLRQKVNGFLRYYGNDSNARLFIYYAGHGYTDEILRYNEYRGYITGIDTPSIDGSARSYDAARLKAISMMEIRSPLAEVLAKHILFVFDSCFAGTIFTSRTGDNSPQGLTPDVVARLMEKPARDIITAGRANERVPAHSPIPKLLLAALSGEADPFRHGVISAAEINVYLRDQVLHLPGVRLTPQQGRLQDPNFAEGEFLFRTLRALDEVEATRGKYANVAEKGAISQEWNLPGQGKSSAKGVPSNNVPEAARTNQISEVLRQNATGIAEATWPPPDWVPLDLWATYTAKPPHDRDITPALDPEPIVPILTKTVKVKLAQPGATGLRSDAAVMRAPTNTAAWPVAVDPIRNTRLVKQPVKNGARYNDPWLRAMILTPSLTDSMTATLYGMLDYADLRALMNKPATSVAMSFTNEPYPGITTDSFSGDAVVFVTTYAFPQRTLVPNLATKAGSKPTEDAR